jgi:hypothetical protein
MRKRLLAGVVLVAVSPATAKELQPLFDAVFGQMANSYICRRELGGLAQYQAARLTAENTLSPYLTHNKAVLLVDQMEQKFKNDLRAKKSPPGASAAVCQEIINDGWQKIEVEKAKIEEKR